ncbi:MAG: ATP-binding protein [Nitrosopumilaceae archaeon]
MLDNELEYYWIEWTMYDSVTKRYAILEKEIFFEEKKEYLSNDIIYVVRAEEFDDMIRRACNLWLDQWIKNGRKWKWYDTWQPTILQLTNDELLEKVKGLIGITDNRLTLFPKENISVLKGKFSDEELNRILPERLKPPSPAGRRTGNIGLILDETRRRTAIPLMYEFDRLAPKNTALIGSTGNGKTIAAYAIAEEALLQNIPVLVLDPTNQWTGFLEPCNDRTMLDRYPDFGIRGPRGFSGRIYTPGVDIGLPLKTNLLSKPETNDESELMGYAIELSDFIEDHCNLSPAENEMVKRVIFDSWINGIDLDYKSLKDKIPDEKIKGKLGNLIAFKILFEGTRLADASSLWNNGAISMISFSNIRIRETQMLVAYFVVRNLVDYFDSLTDIDSLQEKLRFLLIVEEAHNFSGKHVKDILDRASRTLRKKGLGILFITQRFVDLGETQTNINTKVYMRTSHMADIERAGIDLGELSNILPSLRTGTGIFYAPDYGPPTFVEFRPCMHRNSGLSDDEIRRKMH